MLHILFNVYRFYAYITCQAKLDMHIHNHSLQRRAFQKSPTMWIWIRTCGCVRASVLLPDISNIDFEIEFDELFPGSVTNERFPQPFRATATFFFSPISLFPGCSGSGISIFCPCRLVVRAVNANLTAPRTIVLIVCRYDSQSPEWVERKLVVRQLASNIHWICCYSIDMDTREFNIWRWQRKRKYSELLACV